MITYKPLNLFPIYKKSIKQRVKTSSVRLGDKRSEFKIGDYIMLTLGWTEQEAKPTATAQVTQLIYKHIEAVTADDLKGETEECQNPQALPYILGIIYGKSKIPYFNRQTLHNSCVTIIKWSYV